MKQIPLFLLLLMALPAFFSCNKERRQERLMKASIKDYDPAAISNLRINGVVSRNSVSIRLRDPNDFFMDYDEAEQHPFFLRLNEQQSLAVSPDGINFYPLTEHLVEIDGGEYPNTYELYYRIRDYPQGNPDSLTLRLIAGDTLYIRFDRKPLDIRLRSYSPAIIGYRYLVTLNVENATIFRRSDLIARAFVMLANTGISGDIFDVANDTTILVRGDEKATCTDTAFPNMYIFYDRIIRQQLRHGNQAIEFNITQSEETNTLTNVGIIPWCKDGYGEDI